MLDTTTDPQTGYRPAGTLDLATALAPYDGHWGPRQAAHLGRRAGFGPTPDEIAGMVSAGMAGAVDGMLHPQGPDGPFPDYPRRRRALGSEDAQLRRADVVARSHAAHEAAARREDDALLARSFRDESEQGRSALHVPSDRSVPQYGARQFSRSAARRRTRSCHADLAGQSRERRGAPERELRS